MRPCAQKSYLLKSEKDYLMKVEMISARRGILSETREEKYSRQKK